MSNYSEFNTSSQLSSTYESDTLDFEIKDGMIDCKKLVGCFKKICPVQDIISECNLIYQKYDDISNFNVMVVQYIWSQRREISTRMDNEFLICLFSVLFSNTSFFYREFIKWHRKYPFHIEHEIPNIRRVFKHYASSYQYMLFKIGLQYYLTNTRDDELHQTMQETFQENLLSFVSYLKRNLKWPHNYNILFKVVSILIPDEYNRFTRIVSRNKQYIRTIDIYDENGMGVNIFLRLYFDKIIEDVLQRYVRMLPIEYDTVNFYRMSKVEVSEYMFSLIPEPEYNKFDKSVYDFYVPVILQLLDISSRHIQDVVYVFHWNLVKLRSIAPDLIPLFSYIYFLDIIESIKNGFRIVFGESRISGNVVNIQKQMIPDGLYYVDMHNLITRLYKRAHNTEWTNILIESLRDLIEKYMIDSDKPAHLLLNNIIYEIHRHVVDLDVQKTNYIILKTYSLLFKILFFEVPDIYDEDDDIRDEDTFEKISKYIIYKIRALIHEQRHI